MLERGAVCKKTAGARSAGVGWSAGAAIKNRLERGAEGGAEVKKGRSAGALIPLDPPFVMVMLVFHLNLSMIESFSFG